VLSEPYSLSSKIMPGNRATIRSWRNSQILAFLSAADASGRAVPIAPRCHGRRPVVVPLKEQEKLKSDWMQQFVVAFEMTKVRRPRPLTAPFPQALMLMNGDLVKKVINSEKGGFLQTIPGNMKPVEKVQYLFEAALARRPTPGEITVANQLLGREAERQGSGKAKKAAVVDPTSSALQDIFWAVLNSNEFILQH